MNLIESAGIDLMGSLLDSWDDSIPLDEEPVFIQKAKRMRDLL